MKKRTWYEFRETKLLWWVNRSLHLFGWAIVLEEKEDGTIVGAYPARVSFRGFDEDVEGRGFEGLTAYIATEAASLLEDVKDQPPQATDEPDTKTENH